MVRKNEWNERKKEWMKWKKERMNEKDGWIDKWVKGWIDK